MRGNRAWGAPDDALWQDDDQNALDSDGHQTHIMSVVGHESKRCYYPKKVGSLPEPAARSTRARNEIGMAVPLASNLRHRRQLTSPAIALLTQRAIARYLVERGAHYHFSQRQPTDTGRYRRLLFQTRGQPDFVEVTPPEHGRIETRCIWCSTELNNCKNRARIHRQEIRRLPLTRRGLPQTLAGRSLEYRKRPLHHRLELR